MSMRPTPRQRKIARLRECAAIAGLSVQLMSAPESLRLDGLQAFYQRRRRREDSKALRRALYRRHADEWISCDGCLDMQREPLLQEFPEGVAGLVADASGVGVFWAEEGEAADVERISALLERWQGDFS